MGRVSEQSILESGEGVGAELMQATGQVGGDALHLSGIRIRCNPEVLARPADQPA